MYSHLLPRDVEEAVLALRKGTGAGPAQAEPEREDPQVTALAAALAGLSGEQRQALVAALGGS